MSLARRSVTSISWTVLAKVITVSALLWQSIVLARLLPVDVFGVYAGASALVGLTIVVASFGLGGAILHRASETRDEDVAASAHFTLVLIFTTCWALLLGLGAVLWTEGSSRTALITLIAVSFGLQLTATPKMLLVRRVQHRRLAIVSTVISISSAATAVLLARRGVTLWALLARDVVALLITLPAYYAFRPIWRPRLSWSPNIVRYFLHFGSRQFTSKALLVATDRLDDLWTRYVLGTMLMGYYSRAYTFATYPRIMVADPVSGVITGTYAELHGNRRQLSRAFFGVNAVLIRAGIMVAGVLFLVAPEFIRIVLGEKWLPMLTTFQLMLVFTLLDPVKQSVAGVFVAVGEPGAVVKARVIQLAVLLAGLFVLGPLLGIEGVAIAVDMMLLTGMIILLHKARQFVDYSVRRLFVAPLLALTAGILAASSVSSNWSLGMSDWYTGIVKILAFTVVYCVIELILEYGQLIRLLSLVREMGLLGFSLPGLKSNRVTNDE